MALTREETVALIQKRAGECASKAVDARRSGDAENANGYEIAAVILRDLARTVEDTSSSTEPHAGG